MSFLTSIVHTRYSFNYSSLSNSFDKNILKYLKNETNFVDFNCGCSWFQMSGTISEFILAYSF